MEKLKTIGEVSKVVNEPRWRLQYLIERGKIPDASYSVPGRKLFTPQDIKDLIEALKKL